jgi:hypothetical protein
MTTAGATERSLDSSLHLNPMDLLKQAERLSRDFVPEERADILDDLAAAAVPLRPSQAKAWANQLFHISQELPTGQFRASVQRNALCVIAKVDAYRAASLWKLQDAPETWANGRVVQEDIRSDGTLILFPALWQANQAESISTIEALADWLGQTGQYPYGPVAEVMRKLAPVDPQRVQSLYGAGIRYLPNGQRFETTNRQFVSFILSTRNLVDQRSLENALEAAVQSIENASKHYRLPRVTAEVTTPQGSKAFGSQAEVLIYELLPSIREFDPDFARRLIEKYPSFRNGPDLAAEHVHTGGVLSHCDQWASATQNAMDESRLYRVQSMAANDPNQAAQLAMAIRDPDLQSVALATLAPSYSQVNQEEADSWINSAIRRLENMKSEVPKLRLMVALCNDYIVRKRFAEAAEMMQQAFALGELLFNRYSRANPGATAYTADSFDPLSDLVNMTAREFPFPRAVTDAVEHFRNDVLRARMLVVAAAAFSQRSVGDL